MVEEEMMVDGDILDVDGLRGELRGAWNENKMVYERRRICNLAHMPRRHRTNLSMVVDSVCNFLPEDKGKSKTCHFIVHLEGLSSSIAP